MATAPLSYPSRTMRSSEAFQVPGQPQDASQFASADAYNDMLRSRVMGDIDTNRLNDANRGYYQATPNELADMAGNTKFGISSGMAQRELNSRSNEGEFAVPGYGDLGQFAGGGNDNFASKFGGSASFNALKDDNPYNVSAFANGGEAQAPAANPFADPNTMAVYDQMRQTMSPKEFGDEMFAGASQVDPAAMAQFRKDLSEIDLSPEELDMLNNMVDEILATPEQYAAVRAKYLEMGAPEELLPEQFDPQFFAAMNMAVDQLIAEPAGVQAFAMGGIAELKPIAKAIAGYGRNGDTMLAHITPAEARMLRRRGGSGTINPATGLPEFFLKKMFKSLGKAIKSFASSTVGKIVTTVALGFFLGPAAAGLVGATSAAGVAAVGGFVGGAGSTLLAGGNLKDALKAGAIGGLTAGAGAAVGGAMGGTNAFASGSYTGPTTISGQVDRFTNFVNPSATASGIQAPAIDATGQVKGIMPTEAPVFQGGQGYPQAQTFPVGDSMSPAAGPLPEVPAQALRPGDIGSNTLIGGKPALPSFNPEFAAGDPGAGFEPYNKVFADAPARVRAPVSFTETPVGANEQVFRAPSSGMADVTTNTARDLTRPADTSYFNQAKDFYKENFSPSNIQAQGLPEAERAGAAARDAMLARTPNATPAMLDAEYLRASKAAMPGILATYGPITALGLGAVGLAGGFKATDAEPSEMRGELMKPVTQRIAEGGNQRNYYMQGLPGVKYDQYGAPIFGQYNPLPTFDTGLGIESLINPKGFAAGGAADKVFTINNFDQTAYLNAHPDVKAAIAKGDFANAYEHYTKFGKAEGRTAFDKAETDAKAATDRAATEAAQAANRKVVADAKAAKKAAGFGDAYKNINAGLSYDTAAGYAAPSIAARQAAFAPKLGGLQNSMMGNSLTLSTPETQAYLSQNPDVMQAFKASNSGMSPDQFAQAHYQSSGKAEGRTMPVRAPVTQPYNNATGYGNVIKPVTTPVNYDTTPVGTTKPPITGGLGSMIGPVLKSVKDQITSTTMPVDTTKPPVTKGYTGRAITDQEVKDYLTSNPNATDRDLVKIMDQYNVRPDQVARATGMQGVDPSSFQNINFRYADAKSALQNNPNSLARQNQADAVTGKSIQDFFAKNPGMGDEQIANYMDRNMIDPAQMQAAFAGTPGAISSQDVLKRYNAAITGPTRKVFGTDSLPTPPAAVGGQTFIPDARLPEGMMGTMGGTGYDPVTGRVDLGTAGGSGQYVPRAEEPKKLMNMGGIASLGSGGYPRRTGQINGPGTATSDSIPAMLSDGEFVMTAKAVRGAGKGNRRAGAKRMYALMNQLEKNAARG